MMQVSRATLRQTLGELEWQGVVERLHGKGTFVDLPGPGEHQDFAADSAVIAVESAPDDPHDA